jgi:pilus assembly protein CpaC
MRHSSKLLAAASFAALTLSYSGAANGQPPLTEVMGAPRPTPSLNVRRTTVSIPRGKSASIDFPIDMRIGGTADAGIADVRMVTPNHATIIGVGYGQTDAQFYDAQGRLYMVADIRVEQDIRALEDSLARVIPSARIEVQAVGDSVILSGPVANAAEADRAVRVASSYVKDAAQVKNLLTITGVEQVTLKVQVVEVNRSVMKQLGFDTNFIMGQLGAPQWVLGNNPTYAVNGGFQGGINAGYRVDTTSQPVANVPNEISRVLFGESGVNLANLSPTVDAYLRGGTLSAAQRAWVNNYLNGFIGDITILDRFTNPVTGAIEELEVGMSAIGITPNNLPTLAQGYLAGGGGLTSEQRTWFDGFFTRLPQYNTNFVQNVSSTFIDPTNKANPVATNRIGSDGLNQGRALIQAFERQGLVRTLAEPNLTAVSGEAAKFLAGGEFPVPAGRDQQGNVTVEFKPFGVGLGFTPVVLSDGRISMKISTEVSELSTQGALTISGIGGAGSSTVIPALTVRRVDNTVELPSGGYLMMAGLLQEQTRQNIDKVPGLADVPILGSLARSRDYLTNQTELVIIVSAYLTQPTSRDRLQTPADGLRIASDPETVLLGKLNSAYKAPPEANAGRTYQGPFGHVID